MLGHAYPAEQVEHTLELDGAYWPSLHGSGATMPVDWQREPAVQVLQIVRLYTSLYRVVGHATGSAVVVEQYVPGRQPWQNVSPASE